MFKMSTGNSMLNKIETDDYSPKRIEQHEIDSADDLDDGDIDEVVALQKVPESKVKQNTDYFYTKPQSPRSPDFQQIESPSKDKDIHEPTNIKETPAPKTLTNDDIKHMMYKKTPREAAEDYAHGAKMQKIKSASISKPASETISPTKVKNYPYGFNYSPSKEATSPRTEDFDSARKPRVSSHHEGGPTSAYSELAHKLYAERFYSEAGPRKTNLQVSTGNAMLLSEHEVQKVAEKRYLASKEAQEDTTARLMKGGDIKNQYKKALQSAHLSKEQQECTFAPKINSASERPRRNFKQFLDDQKSYQNNIETKKKMKKEQAELKKLSAETTYKPELCQNSVKILSKTTRPESGNIHERLYKTAKNAHAKLMHNAVDAGERTSTESNFVGSKSRLNTAGSVTDSTFVPNIHKKSKNLNRGTRIDNLLYNDALRRQNKHVEMTKGVKSPTATNSVMSLNSKRHIATRFIKEFDIAILEFLEVGREPKLNYIQINEFLRKLCFLKESEQLESPQFTPERLLLYDMWYILYGDKFKGIHRRNLLVFLLAVLNLNFPITMIQKSEEEPHEHDGQGEESIPRLRENGATTEDGQQPLERKIVGHYDADGNYILEPEEVQKVHKMYNIWYMNRLCASDNIGQLISARSYEDFAYQPQINDMSRALAQNYREKILEGTAELIQQNKIPAPKDGRITHVDLLIVSKKVVQEKVNKFGSILNEEKSKDYTFRPSTLAYNPNTNSSVMRSFQGENSELRSPSKKQNPMPAGSMGSSRVYELYSLAKPHALKRDKNSNELDFEKNQDECTFQPNIHRSQNLRNEAEQRGVYAKGIDKAIDRMRTAQAEKDYTKSLLQRGYGSNGSEGGFVFGMDKSKFKKNEIPQTYGSRSEQYYAGQNEEENQEEEEENMQMREGGEMDSQEQGGDENNQYYEGEGDQVQGNLETDQDQAGEQEEEDNYYMEDNENENEAYQASGDQMNNSQGRSNQSRGHNVQNDADNNEEPLQNDQAPLLFVDVNLGHGKSERITIHEGDNADELATRFCEEHNLDDFMQQKLRELLESQIAGLLTRIDEEGSSPSDSRRHRYGGEYEDGNQIAEEEDDYVEEDSEGAK